MASINILNNPKYGVFSQKIPQELENAGYVPNFGLPKKYGTKKDIKCEAVSGKDVAFSKLSPTPRSE